MSSSSATQLQASYAASTGGLKTLNSSVTDYLNSSETNYKPIAVKPTSIQLKYEAEVSQLPDLTARELAALLVQTRLFQPQKKRFAALKPVITVKNTAKNTLSKLPLIETRLKTKADKKSKEQELTNQERIRFSRYVCQKLNDYYNAHYTELNDLKAVENASKDPDKLTAYIIRTYGMRTNGKGEAFFPAAVYAGIVRDALLYSRHQGLIFGLKATKEATQLLQEMRKNQRREVSDPIRNKAEEYFQKSFAPSDILWNDKRRLQGETFTDPKEVQKKLQKQGETFINSDFARAFFERNSVARNEGQRPELTVFTKRVPPFDFDQQSQNNEAIRTRQSRSEKPNPVLDPNEALRQNSLMRQSFQGTAISVSQHSKLDAARERMREFRERNKDFIRRALEMD